MAFLVVVGQCLVATILVEAVRRMGYASYDPFNFSTARRWLPVSICFSAMLFTSFKALEVMNVPMVSETNSVVTVFKNLTNIVIVTGDWWFFQQAASWLVIFSMAVMVFGAIFASYNDLDFNPWGYFWMVANCCTTAGYVLYMKHATKSIKLPRFGMVFYNNLLTTCLLTPAAFMMGDFTIFWTTPQLRTVTYIAALLFSGVVGVMLNFASLWCVGATSATTYAVVGSVNVVPTYDSEIPTALLGYQLFDSAISTQMGEFMLVSMIGGFMYSFAKLQEKRSLERTRPPVMPLPSPSSALESHKSIAEKLLLEPTTQADQTADHNA
ncbi:unnamed protein product [Ectocarpus sp. CCAP 1310/34]|nr:unnamed protein product [Ectocarpus sp. CCAP 1310/34]